MHEEHKYRVDATHVQGLVSGECNLVLQYFTAGISALSPDYATRIQNFLLAYLGTAEHPVPFGGRQEDLNALGHWLDDPGGTPYTLMAAPAGRGKSAVLVQWLQQLVERKDVAVVFLPVSIRFRTNLSSVVFGALAARLATLHGEEVPTLTLPSAEAWRDLVSRYLTRPAPDGRQILVVLDGVDEAADWQVGPDLFPFAPPMGLRAVVSARYRADVPNAEAWLAYLGWQRGTLATPLTLEPLDQEGVADVLNKMGVPLDHLAKDVDVVAELRRLSEGDPLLVRLYVDHLREQGGTLLRLQDLPAVPPGLDGYFRLWWKEQRQLWGNQTPLREPAVQAVLNVLACALGPLSASDMLVLAPELSTWLLEESIQPLARFIVGNDRQQGYTFNHPRLAQHFYDRLTPGERSTIEARFREWGVGVVTALDEERVQPRDVPFYLSQYLAVHLCHLGDHAALFRLVDSPRWYKAQVTIDPSGAGYLSDLAQAWAAANDIDGNAVEQGDVPPMIGRELHCALASASLHSLSHIMPPTLLAALVVAGLWTPAQALVLALRNTKPRMVVRAITALAPHLSRPLLHDALDRVRAWKGAPERGSGLAIVSAYLPSTQRDAVLQEALEIIRAIEDAEERARIWTDVIPYLTPMLEWEFSTHRPDSSWPRWAFAALRPFVSPSRGGSELIVSDSDDAAANTTLQPTLGDAVLTEALRTAWTADEPLVRARAFASLAAYLPATVFDEAILTARAVAGDVERIRLLAALIPHLSTTRHDEVLQASLAGARSIEWPWDRAQALAALLPCLPLAHEDAVLHEAMLAAWSDEWPAKQAEALTFLVPYLPESTLPDVLVLIRAHGDVEALVALASRWPAARNALLQEALERVQKLGDEAAQVRAFVIFALHLPPAIRDSVLSHALDLARELRRGETRAQMLALLAPHVPTERAKLLEEALEIARVEWRESVKVDLPVALVPQLDAPMVTQALGIAQTLRLEWDWIRALQALASYLSDTDLQSVLDMVWAPRWQGHHREMLTAVAPYLSPQLVEQALATALGRKSYAEKLDAVVALGPYLSEHLQRRALDIVRHAPSWGVVLSSVTALARHLPTQMLLQMLERARQNGLSRQYTHLVAAVAPRLPLIERASLLQRALTIVDTFTWDGDIVEALVALVPLLPESLLEEALAVAGGLEFANSHLLAVFAARLPSEWTTEAFSHVQEEDDRSVQAGLLAALSPYLPESLLYPALQSAEAIDDTSRRACTLEALNPRLATIPTATLYSWWAPSLHTMSRRTREDVLSDLAALAPVIVALGGKDAADGIVQAILDVSNWWP